MRVAAGHGEAARWIQERTQCALTQGARFIKATDAAGRIRGVVAYDCWTENAVQAHMAVDTPVACRSLLPAVFEYPFLEAGKGLLLGLIPAFNARSCNLVLRLGFTETYRIRDGWSEGVDMVVYELRRDDCRWLQRKDN